MATQLGATTPYWTLSALFPQFEPLDHDTSTDVLVIGGGITGLTAAYLLTKAGRNVVLVDRRRCADADTGHTSAHLTMVTDTRLGTLASRLGRERARAVWDAGLIAMGQIDQIVRDHDVKADLAWLPGYLHAPLDGEPDDTDGLKGDAALARELGFDAEYFDSVPVAARPGVRFDGQARVHPRQYLAGLAQAFANLGGRIFERSEADRFNDGPRTVECNRHTIACHDIVIATHSPLAGYTDSASAAMLQSKLALYTTYVVAGRAPHGSVPDALWWDTAEPYHYMRIVPLQDSDLIVLGGEDHKTGQQPDTESCYRRLEARLHSLVPDVAAEYRWSGQVVETPDGLPFIGETARHQFSATGYGGNGLTFGTLAGMMVTDAILGRKNPWAELFDPSRRTLAAGTWTYLRENADYPFYMLRDRVVGAERRPLRSLKSGEGAVVELDGKAVAASRDEFGVLTMRSATCTHMGCRVAWNTAERTWDCPCHGSRFMPDGRVIAGPAEDPLGRVD